MGSASRGSILSARASPLKPRLLVVLGTVAAFVVIGAIGLVIALSAMPCGTLGGSCGPGSVGREAVANPDRCIDVDDDTRQAIESSLNVGLVEETDRGWLRLDRAEPVAWIAASSSAGFRPRVVWVAAVLDIRHSQAPSDRGQWTTINEKRIIALFAAELGGSLFSYGDRFVPPSRLPLTTTLPDYTDWTEGESRDEWDRDAIASLAECAAAYSPEDWLWEITSW